MRNPLDPFLNKIAREYIDDEDLSAKMLRYFKARERKRGERRDGGMERREGGRKGGREGNGGGGD